MWTSTNLLAGAKCSRTCVHGTIQAMRRSFRLRRSPSPVLRWRHCVLDWDGTVLLIWCDLEHSRYIHRLLNVHIVTGVSLFFPGRTRNPPGVLRTTKLMQLSDMPWMLYPARNLACTIALLGVNTPFLILNYSRYGVRRHPSAVWVALVFLELI